tara:strand:+ start:445 stop:1554 length:1110 start_codon:yes stop_codon:yes gene_type:complete
MKKILIVTWVPMYSWDYKRLDLQNLKKKFHIIIYDVSKIYFKKINLKKIYKNKNLIKSLKFSNIKDFYKKIRKQKIDLIINLTGVKKSNFIYKEMKKKNVKILNFIDARDLFYFVYPKKLYYFLRYVLKKIFINFKKKAKEVSIVSGKNFMNNYFSLGHEKINSHSINYDYYLRKKKFLNKKKNKKIATYLDSGHGFHPDYVLNKNTNKKFNIKTFSTKLNYLFFILKKMGYQIYFLSHPKISKKNQSIYKNCKIVYFKTYEYVEGSDLIITSHSSTIDYPIILKKKILRIYSKEFKSYPVVEKIFMLTSKFFENEGLNIDNIKELSKKKIDKAILFPGKKYEEFLNKFIRHPKSKNEIFLNIISKIIG